MKYTSFDPEAKAIGRAMLGLYEVVDKDIMDPLLSKHGLSNIQPDQWYLLQTWLDVLTDISMKADKINRMLTFVDIGRKVAKNVYISEDMEQAVKELGFIEFLARYGAATYYRDHQGYVGQYTVNKINAQHLAVTLISPYPPDFWYGILYGFASRHCTSFHIQYQDISMLNAERQDEPVIIHVIVDK